MLQHHYTNDCMQNRNKYMVDNSDIVIAVWNGKPSGTGSTVRYAHEKGKTIIVVTHDPEVGEVAERVVRLEHGKIISDKKNKQFIE